MNAQALREALTNKLPQEFHDQIESIIEIVLDETDQKVFTATPRVAQALKSLDGQQIRAGEALLSFGEDNQSGDIRIENVVNGNPIHITIHPKMTGDLKSQENPTPNRASNISVITNTFTVLNILAFIFLFAQWIKYNTTINEVKQTINRQSNEIAALHNTIASLSNALVYADSKITLLAETATATNQHSAISETVIEGNTTNIVTNGDFEDSIENSVWEWRENTQVSWAAGFRGRALCFVQIAEEEQPSQWAFVYQSMSLIPGEKYNFSYRIKYDDVRKVHAKLDWYKEDGSFIDWHLLSAWEDGTSSGWVLREGQFIVPLTASKASFVTLYGVDVEKNIPGGSVCIDDVVIKPS